MAGSFEGSYGCMGNLLKADYIDAVIAVGSLGVPSDFLDHSTATVGVDTQEYVKMMIEMELRFVDGLIERIDRHQKPLIITSPVGGVGGVKPPALAKLEENGIYHYQTPEEGSKVISYLVRYAEYLGLTE